MTNQISQSKALILSSIAWSGRNQLLNVSSPLNKNKYNQQTKATLPKLQFERELGKERMAKGHPFLSIHFLSYKMWGDFHLMVSGASWTRTGSWRGRYSWSFGQRHRRRYQASFILIMDMPHSLRTRDGRGRHSWKRLRRLWSSVGCFNRVQTHHNIRDIWSTRHDQFGDRVLNSTFSQERP